MHLRHTFEPLRLNCTVPEAEESVFSDPPLRCNPSNAVHPRPLRIVPSPLKLRVQGSRDVYEGQQGSLFGCAQDDPIRPNREDDSSPGVKQALFDESADAILLFNPSWDIVSVNAAAVRMFGCDEDQMVDTHVLQWIVERNRARHLTEARAFIDGHIASVSHGRTDEAGALRSDGSEFPVEVTKSKIALGERLMYAVTVRDITERLKVRDELSAALSSMRDSVCVADARGGLVRFNDSFLSFHRLKSRAECQMPLDELMELFDVTTLDGGPVAVDQRLIPRALNGESGSGVEFRVRRKDTGESWVGSYSFSPIRNKLGAIVGAVVTGRDVTNEKDILSALKHSRAELRRLVAGQQGAAEDERKRIARELHDDLQQTLAALRLNVASLEQQSSAVSPSASQAATAALALSDCAILSTRRMISGLRPQVLDDFGLTEAITSVLRAFGDRTAVGHAMEVLGDVEAEMPSEVATCLFRILQESLQNVEKHARADHVHIQLDLSDPDQVVLQIRDDGVGIRAADFLKRQSFGVLGMEERARALGGTLKVVPGSVSGTAVEAVVPLRAGGSIPAGRTNKMTAGKPK
ncbi:MAG: hypothetical protein B7Y51_07205 [Burkholderiales bacterium 28-67-8]|nr:MAG: hypothetical protein B7Y51_07205 [Burkholderiales bacterium 28-67-8]